MPHANDLTVTRTSEREVMVRRSFQAPRSAVFAALTTPAQLQQWLSANGREMTVCEVDLRPGGAYRYVFPAPNGREFVMYGNFREVVPGERIVHTESYVGLEWAPLVTTTLLTEQAGRTTMEMRILYPNKQVCDVDAPNQEQGVDEAYARLDRLLASRGGG